MSSIYQLSQRSGSLELISITVAAVQAFNGRRIAGTGWCRGAPKVVCFDFFDQKSGMLCRLVVHHQTLRLSQNTTLQIGTTHECTVAVSDMLLVTCKWRYCCRFWAVHAWSQRCSDWCALGCSATVAVGCDCSSHVSGWLTLVDVFAGDPPGMSRFLSCRVGGCFCGPCRLPHRGIWIQNKRALL